MREIGDTVIRKKSVRVTKHYSEAFKVFMTYPQKSKESTCRSRQATLENTHPPQASRSRI